MNRTPIRFWVIALALAVCSGAGPSQARVRTWTFDDAPTGRIPPGWTVVGGDWSVAADGATRVLAQRARSPDDVFNLALIDRTRYGDVDLSVRFRADGGDVDQGGGLVWRAADGRTYYLARFNPLEDNLRAYRVIDGRRTMLKGVKVALPRGWHELRATMEGDRIRCFLDGKEWLDVADSTLPGPGMIGLWTKADARTSFQLLTANGKEDHSGAPDNRPSPSAVAECLAGVRAVHGTASPGAVAGYRAGLHALKAFGLPRYSAKLRVVHHAPAKADYASMADGLAAATGASIGKLNLRLNESPAEAMKTVVDDRESGRRLVFTYGPEVLHAIRDVPVDRQEGEARRVAELPEEAVFQVVTEPARRD